MEKVTLEELAVVSMNVILHAGHARDFVFQAVDKASAGEFEEADKLMDEANSEIVIAHKAQTKTLQKEADGIEFPFSPLFAHAQDTMMTVKSEINTLKEIIKLYKTIRGSK
ncbi:Lactose-specific phosphotransferase enzyme IIA component [compost metagenome]